MSTFECSAVRHGLLPPVVTFTTGAPLLAELGLVDSITPDGLRGIARRRDWPFGPDRKHQYGQLGNAKTMDTEAFLDYFRTGSPRGGRRWYPKPS